jgi:hypothetical protein
MELAADNWDTTKLELYQNLIILHTQLNDPLPNYNRTEHPAGQDRRSSHFTR